MTQKEKQLLLIDLSARLFYGVMCQVDDGAAGLNDGKLVEIDISKELVRFDADYYWDAYIDDIKPYLRSMSSMTEEEAKELLFIRLDSKYDDSCANSIKLIEVSFQKKSPCKGSISVWFSFENKIHDICSKCEYLGRINDITLAEIDWLNAHRFDYRGLIERGLAIDATGLGIY